MQTLPASEANPGIKIWENKWEKSCWLFQIPIIKWKINREKKDNQLNWRQNGTGTITIAVKSMRGEEDLMGTCLVVEDKQVGHWESQR